MPKSVFNGLGTGCPLFSCFVEVGALTGTPRVSELEVPKLEVSVSILYRKPRHCGVKRKRIREGMTPIMFRI